MSVSSRSQRRRTSKQQRQQRLIIGAAAGGILALIVGAVLVWSGKNQQGKSAKPNATTETRPEPLHVELDPVQNPQEIPLEESARQCRIYTEEPGFAVVVDGEVVRADNHALVLTPCAVMLPKGTHSITVAKLGYFDATQQIDVRTDDAEAVFEPNRDSAGTADSILNAPYFDLQVNEPIPLKSLNSADPEFSPYVTPDGLSIWFAADRSEGGGIYFASRPSPFHEFGEPSLLLLSRGRGMDMPDTPSVTADSRFVVYTVPQKARIWRSSETTHSAISTTAARSSSWTPARRSGAAQILPDGLRLYWVQEDQSGLHSYAAVRSSVDKSFGNSIPFKLPGTHPCLSKDGLRQFAFDGKQLQRPPRVRSAGVRRTRNHR